jgi:hypothetical protein
MRWVMKDLHLGYLRDLVFSLLEQFSIGCVVVVEEKSH